MIPRKTILLSATIIPGFYFVLASFFIFSSVLPESLLSIVGEENRNLAILVTRERGVLFLVGAILLRSIYWASFVTYVKLLNIFTLIVLLTSIIEPFYYYYTKQWQIWVFFSLNIVFIAILQYERYKLNYDESTDTLHG